MNERQFERIHTGKGFIAALDQSGGSTPQALREYGLPESAYSGEEAMFRQVHAMRTRIITSPAFDGQRILGAILFEDTLRRTVEDLPTAEYLWTRKGIVPFVKVDRGLDTLESGVRLMKPITDLESVLELAVEQKVFGTKMRSFIADANPAGIASLVEQQFAVAMRIFRSGLIPIIEPKVDIRCPQKAKAEELLKRELWGHLSGLERRARIMFKFTIPDVDGLYSDLMADPRVVRVVALSGGYGREEADARLARNPGLIASFSRALTEGLRADQSDEDFNKTLDASVQAIYAASVT